MYVGFATLTDDANVSSAVFVVVFLAAVYLSGVDAW